MLTARPHDTCPRKTTLHLYFHPPMLRPIAWFELFIMLATVAQWLVLATVTGLLVGTGTSLFLHALFYMTARTAAAPFWLVLVLLPLGGILNGLLLHYGQRVNTSGLKDSVFAAVHAQHGRMPLRTLWLKPAAALVTLACGGSAGKEGPCSHIGAVLASAIGRVLHLNAALRERLVACGISAGFASVFGTPIGGAIYGVEVLSIGRIRSDFLLPAVVAGAASFEISRWWGLAYPVYAVKAPAVFSEALFFKAAVIGILCGLAALLFVEALKAATHFFGALRKRFHVWPPLMPFIGGCALALLVLVIPTDYLGLSLPLMDQALSGAPMPALGVLWKILLVAVTLGSGFYGGIVTPQFVLGAIAGNAAAHLLGISPALGGAIGLTAAVAAASNTPLAAILMGIELFGDVGVGYLAVAALAAYVVIGHRSVYPEQHVAYAKSPWLHIHADRAIGATSPHLSHGLLRWWKKHEKQKENKRKTQHPAPPA